MKTVVARTLAKKLLLLGMMALTPWPLPAADSASTPGAQARRFSLAIRGGASLGAYEAGLNWAGLEILRKLSQHDAAPGGRVRPFEAAGFAGTSAGSINALMSAMVWCVRPEQEGGFVNRLDDNLFRNLWMAVDVNVLLPPRPDSPLYRRDDALLSRKSLLDAAERLRERWRSPAFRAGCSVPLGASVTRVTPDVLRVEGVDVQNQRFYIPFEFRARTDGSAAFYFDPADYPTLVDPAMVLLPRERGAPPAAIGEERVMDALLASAAVPLGFGRKRLDYCRLKPGLVLGDAIASEASAPPNPGAALVCPHGYELTAAEFADGGLFDNLPIGLARVLAESHRRAQANPLPVIYLYLDPDRTRYETPKPRGGSACEMPNPPPACGALDYGVRSESQLLSGALGTARRYELYREFTSDHWTLSLSDLAAALAGRLADGRRDVECADALPFFDANPSCPEALRHAARLLELAYGGRVAVLGEPYSVRKLQGAGIARDCRRPSNQTRAGQRVCALEPQRLRDSLARGLIAVLERANLAEDPLMQRVQRSRLAVHNDRSLRVSSRGAPVTGSLLGTFGAFLDAKFRAYDYYVGVYDAVIAISESVCRMQLASVRELAVRHACLDEASGQFYAQLAIDTDPAGRYVFAQLARAEFERHGLLRYAYQPAPAEDRDMRIVYEGLALTLQAGDLSPDASQGVFFVEQVFFRHLKEAGFVPTPTDDGRAPLLAHVMADPEQWSYELVRRATGRLVHLEQDARGIFAAREPEPTKREESLVGVLGASAHLLRSVTYKYPDYSFAPSTAPEEWFWRNLIPYELAIDMVEGDTLLIWQPSWSLSPHALFALRAGLGFSRGFLDAAGDVERGNYAVVGPELTRLTGRQLLSSWGAGLGYYYAFDAPSTGSRDSIGGDLHVSWFTDRVRLSLGTRDFGAARDNWFLSVGLTDLPGLMYWLTR